MSIIANTIKIEAIEPIMRYFIPDSRPNLSLLNAESVYEQIPVISKNIYRLNISQLSIIPILPAMSILKNT